MGHHDVEKWPIRAAVQGHAYPYRHRWARKYTDLRVKKRNVLKSRAQPLQNGLGTSNGGTAGYSLIRCLCIYLRTR